MIREVIEDKLIDTNIENYIKQYGKAPDYKLQHKNTTNQLDSIFDINNIPKINYRDTATSSTVNSDIKTIQDIFTSISNSSESIINEHKHLSDSYADISTRVDNELYNFNQSINTLLNYACYKIDTSHLNQLPESNVGVIGSYITNPFFIKDASMYYDYASVAVISNGTITYENTSNITSIPLNDSIAVKATSSNSSITTTFTITINETTSNLIYLKFLNDITNITVKLSLDSKDIFTQAYTNNEILVNTSPITYDCITVMVTQNNPNIDKPVSTMLQKIEIFKEILFSKTGIFESIPMNITQMAGASNIKLSYANLGSATGTNVSQYISVNSTETASSVIYSQIEENEEIDISLIRYKYGTFIQPSGSTVQFVSKKSNEIENKSLYSYTINSPSGTSDPMYKLWNMNYQKAIIFYGLNKDYLSPYSTAEYDNYRFENWTFNNNYYKTYCANYEESCTVDVGTRKIILNGKTATGKIKIPVGISTIEVHSKDMKLLSGSDILSESEVVKSENMYPDNLLYTFAGLPEYPLNNISKSFKVMSNTTIDLNESFIPFTESITDNNGIVYKMQLTRSTNVPGTYSILPNGGKINICPVVSDNNEITLNVTYKRAIPNKRPCGVLFNRLLTFAPLDSILNSNFGDNMLFGFDGNASTRYLYMPVISGTQTKNIQVMYNTNGEGLYTSVKLALESTDKYISPLISSIGLTVI